MAAEAEISTIEPSRIGDRATIALRVERIPADRLIDGQAPSIEAELVEIDTDRPEYPYREYSMTLNGYLLTMQLVGDLGKTDVDRIRDELESLCQPSHGEEA